MKSDMYQHLLEVADSKGAAFVVLLDPENEPIETVARKARLCEEAGVDAIFVGGSLVQTADTNAFVKMLKESTSLPIIGFPGSSNQISEHLDAVLFLSVVSGRNTDFLFGRHVYVAPLIKKLGIEPIATAYMLVESEHLTAAQYLTNSLPLPRNKPDIAAATALAAEMMGMKLLYLEGGAGASEPVPVSMIRAVAACCESPIVVGGGLRTAEEVRERVEAGASIIVVGNALEEKHGLLYMREMAEAAHTLL